jgi:acetyl-CoA C-acetyltransferase
MEVHDCFSVTELVLMEDLGMSDEGRAPVDILDGACCSAGRARDSSTTRHWA